MRIRPRNRGISQAAAGPPAADCADPDHRLSHAGRAAGRYPARLLGDRPRLRHDAAPLARGACGKRWPSFWQNGGAPHEGHHPRRRLGHAALSRDARHQQAAAAGLRQADDLLSAVGADARRHPRHPADLDARAPARSTGICSATAPPGGSSSLTSSRTSRSASPMPSSSAATLSAMIASR